MESKKREITAVGESGFALQSWGLIHSPALCTRGSYLSVWHGDFVPLRIVYSYLKSTAGFCFSLISLTLPAGGEAMKHIDPWVGVLDKEFEKQIIPLQLKLL